MKEINLMILGDTNLKNADTVFGDDLFPYHTEIVKVILK